MDVLACLAHESCVVLVAARQLQAGAPLEGADADRLSMAVRRIEAGLEMSHGY
jgi:hypothetical protein